MTSHWQQKIALFLATLYGEDGYVPQSLKDAIVRALTPLPKGA